MRQSQELQYSDIVNMPISALQQISPMMAAKAMDRLMHANVVLMYEVCTRGATTVKARVVAQDSSLWISTCERHASYASALRIERRI